MELGHVWKPVVDIYGSAFSSLTIVVNMHSGVGHAGWHKYQCLL
jgi:hypothetical protein